MIYHFIFSPTGGTSAVAGLISASFEKGTEIQLCVPEKEIFLPELSDNDLAFISVPSFRGRVPALAVERLRKLHGNGARAIITVVYGNREYEDTLIELSDTVKEVGFAVIAAVSAVAQHSEYPRLAEGRPDADDALVLHDFSEQISNKVAKGETSEPAIPGNRPYKPDNASSTPPVPDETCTGCMHCAYSCPVGAIDMENPAFADSNKCISCMRCVSACQTGARKIPPQTSAFLEKLLAGCFARRKEPELFL